MRFKSGLVLTALTLGASALPVFAQSPGVAPTHGVAMHGDPKYGPDFKHFDYVNPSAPKGGVIRQGVDRGTFNTFNPYTLKGDPAAGLGMVDSRAQH